MKEKWTVLLLLAVSAFLARPLTGVGAGQTQEPIKAVFADSGLEDAIREAVGKPKGDIFLKDLKTVKVLFASERHISDLGSIEQLVYHMAQIG